MNKPVIGVLPLYDKDKASYWMLPGYFLGLQAAGALPLMLPLEGLEDLDQLTKLCDGFLFTGGQDVDPACYQEALSPQCGELCPRRDRLELALLRRALEAGKPILGICRGLQLMNVGLGGSLYQDLPSQRPGPIRHRMEAPYDREAHSVKLPGPLATLLGTEQLGVNSCHHQGVKDLAPGLLPMAWAQDGLVEAFYHPDQPFVWAVQWHPEFYDPNQGPGAPIFRAFVQAAAKQ